MWRKIILFVLYIKITLIIITVAVLYINNIKKFEKETKAFNTKYNSEKEMENIEIKLEKQTELVYNRKVVLYVDDRFKLYGIVPRPERTTSFVSINTNKVVKEILLSIEFLDDYGKSLGVKQIKYNDFIGNDLKEINYDTPLLATKIKFKKAEIIFNNNISYISNIKVINNEFDLYGTKHIIKANRISNNHISIIGKVDSNVIIEILNRNKEIIDIIPLDKGVFRIDKFIDYGMKYYKLIER